MEFDDEKRKSRIVICGVATTVLIVLAIMLATMLDVVDNNQAGLLIDEFSGAVLEKKSYATGQYFTGLGRTFIRFNKTIHSINMIYEGSGTPSDDVGSAASNPFGGPITIRTIDGQMIDMEVSLQYTLDTEKLYDIYVKFGLKYDEYVTSIVRAKSRDEAAKRKANEYFENRMSIEQDLSRTLKESLASVHCDLVDFQLMNVFLPSELENTIKNIQEKRLKVDLKNVQLKTTEITANTTLAVKEVNAETAKSLAEYAASTRNIILELEQQRDLYKEETATISAISKKTNEMEINIKDAVVDIIDANYTGDIMKIDAMTRKMLANVTNKAKIEEATFEKEITSTLSNADAYAYEQKYNATSVAMKDVAAAYDTAYTKISGKGFNAGDINHLEWSDFFSNHPSSKLHMDLSQPTRLYLDSTQASNHDANMQSNSNDL